MTAMKPLTILSAVLLIAGFAHAGTIKGKVTYEGTPPARPALKATKDQHCINTVAGTKSEALVVSKGKGIKNVVISVRSRKLKAKLPAKNPVLDQIDCAYVPYVLAVVAGSTIDVTSSDPVAHNVHSHAKKDPAAAVNWQIAQKGKVFPLTLNKAENRLSLPVIFTSGMTGYVVVVENNHFAVTGYKDKAGKWLGSDAYEKSADAGTFTIPDVPAGKYRLQAWHSELGTATARVTVEASGEG